MDAEARVLRCQKIANPLERLSLKIERRLTKPPHPTQTIGHKKNSCHQVGPQGTSLSTSIPSNLRGQRYDGILQMQYLSEKKLLQLPLLLRSGREVDYSLAMVGASIGGGGMVDVDCEDDLSIVTRRGVFWSKRGHWLNNGDIFASEEGFWVDGCKGIRRPFAARFDLDILARKIRNAPGAIGDREEDANVR